MREANPPASDHWRRFRRLMMLMVGLAAVAIAGALALLHNEGVVLHMQFMIALGLGIGVSLLLAGALMGLVFVSANSGHDRAVHDTPASDAVGRHPNKTKTQRGGPSPDRPADLSGLD